jgi:hypothetical protein
MRIISLLGNKDRDMRTTRFLVCQHEGSPPVEVPARADGCPTDPARLRNMSGVLQARSTLIADLNRICEVSSTFFRNRHIKADLMG